MKPTLQRRERDVEVVDHLLVGELTAMGHPHDVVSELLRESLGYGNILPARGLRAIGMSRRVGADSLARDTAEMTSDQWFVSRVGNGEMSQRLDGH